MSSLVALGSAPASAAAADAAASSKKTADQMNHDELVDAILADLSSGEPHAAGRCFCAHSFDDNVLYACTLKNYIGFSSAKPTRVEPGTKLSILELLVLLIPCLDEVKENGGLVIKCGKRHLDVDILEDVLVKYGLDGYYRLAVQLFAAGF